MTRCFGDGDPLYEAYHDDEWGRPVTDERGLFERVCLEAFQSGPVVAHHPAQAPRLPRRLRRLRSRRGRPLRRRPTSTRLLGDAGIVRNRAKIEATIANARRHRSTCATRARRSPSSSGPTAPPRGRRRPSFADVAGQIAGVRGAGQGAQARGFRFVGPTTIYAGMQACGLVNDHLATCPVRERFEALQAAVAR